MKKDVEWAQKEIDGYLSYERVDAARKALVFAKSVINQLDEPEVLSQELVDRNKEPFHHFGNNKVDYYVSADSLQNLLTPKQELPVVPTWFDEWWRDVAKGGGVLFHNMQRFHNELYISGTRETCDYIGVPDNKKKLLNIIINELDYEVEEEPLYYALVKGHELIDGDFKYFNLDVLSNALFVGSRHFTEKSKSEWNEIGINDSNADFVKAEDAEE